MGLEKDVLRIKKKLENMMSSDTSDHAAALDLLNSLKRLPMNLEVLQKTKIGISVNNFRKAVNNDEVVNLAKSLIKGWKKLLSANDNSGSQTSSKSPSSSSARTHSPGVEEDSRDSAPGSTQGSDSESSRAPDTEAGGEPCPRGLMRQPSLPADVEDTDDPVRVKCRELLTNALKTKPEVEACATHEALAAAIEHFIFKEFKKTEMKYKNRVRSRVANLKDLKNPKLRESVLIGLIPPEKIAAMTAEEMASDELKHLREKFTKEAIDDHQMSQQQGTKTDFFKCGRCGKRNCSYNQVQTRSADEPMTTFVLCNECGNRWKFC